MQREFRSEIIAADLRARKTPDRVSGNFVGRIKGAKCPFDLQFLTWDFS